jgi:hypothetical protein
MAAPYDPSAARVRVSTTEAGTYNVIGKCRGFDMTEGEEGGATIYWQGGDASRPGNPTLGGTRPVWFDLDDTTGQDILRTAKRNQTAVWIQHCPTGTAAGQVVEQFEAYITEFSRSHEVTADGIEGSFSFRGTPSELTEVTLA